MLNLGPELASPAGLLVGFTPGCLAVHPQAPLAYLRQTSVQPHVRALSHFGDDEPFTRIEDVMAFWQRRSSELAALGTFRGALHFDLVAARAALKACATWCSALTEEMK